MTLFDNYTSAGGNLFYDPKIIFQLITLIFNLVK